MQHPGRDIKTMREHDVFLLIYSCIGHLYNLEQFNPSSDEIELAKIDLTRNINMGIVMMNFTDTVIYGSGEVIPGEEFHSWYENWFDWFEQIDFEEFDPKYLSGEDLTDYLPPWYNYEKAKPVVEEKYGHKTSNIN